MIQLTKLQAETISYLHFQWVQKHPNAEVDAINRAFQRIRRQVLKEIKN
jgi:hypothetical protein